MERFLEQILIGTCVGSNQHYLLGFHPIQPDPDHVQPPRIEADRREIGTEMADPSLGLSLDFKNE